MSHGHPTRRRRIVTRAAPLLLALGALPLLAPTCGPGLEGDRTFAQYSLIIPMDRCYQYQVDSVSGTTTPTGCPQAAAPGDVIKAYGLVYQLIRNDVAVYWVIDQTKQSFTAYDLSIQYDGGFPALKYDWTNGGKGAPPTSTADHLIRYMGGPFVVDGSDYAKASAVLQKYKGTFGNVNVHVSNVAFRAHVKKTLAGGWNAGAAVPPKIALLDIGSGELSKQTKPLCDPTHTSNCLCNPAYPNLTNCSAICTGPNDTTHNCDAEYCIGTVKNSQQVIEGYLTWAGIGGSTSCADPNNCPGGKAAGPHGQIYDRLTMADFQPTPGGDWKTTNFYKNSADGRAAAGITDGSGYQLLWVPHWTAPGSCSAAAYNTNDDIRACACLASRHTAAQVDAALVAIGNFVAGGNDLFGECSGLGSFEGVLDSSNTPTVKFGDAVPETHFQTTTGMKINQKNVGAATTAGNFASPLMQLGDYVFKPVDGAIKIYKPAASYVGAPPVAQLFSDVTDPTLDYFTMLPAVLDANSVPTRGSVVYLAGHSYNANQGTQQIGGSRLVLNTLFNLGAGCTQSGVSCDTGKLGVCAKGVLACSANGVPECQQIGTASPETCNGLDDDCDGLVDEDLETSCYDEPVAGQVTRNVGECRDGIRSCERRPDGTYGMSACQGQRGPSPEVCNNLDDNCNGQVDETLEQACYFGPQSSLDGSGVPMGACKAGVQTCAAGNWGACTICTTETSGTEAYRKCQILPATERCNTTGDQVDENCDGIVNESTGEGCGACTAGNTQSCYTGPAGTLNIGACKGGTQTCTSSGSWGPCISQVTPKPEVCGNQVDDDCDGQVDEDCGCKGPVECYTLPGGVSDATAGVGVCKKGFHSCVDGVEGTVCEGQVLPGVEVCDAKDNNCDGNVDENPDTLCSTGYTCVTGVCVPKQCGVERPCPEGFACKDEVAGVGKCAPDVCGDSVCPAGLSCDNRVCIDRCADDPCGTGAFCSSGTCMGGSCYYTGCDAGFVCKEGACQPDACSGVSCPFGTFCRAGDCVQSCAFVDCPSGQRCGADGFCEADRCAGRTCAPAQRCVDGLCQADPCAGKSCGTGQVCQAKDGEAVCVDSPCTGVVCPVGQCIGGQCFPAGNPASVGDGTVKKSSSGCSSAGGTTPLWTVLLLALAPLARRRRAPRGGGALVAVLAGVVLLGSACKKNETEFDPSKCQTACPGVNHCVDVWTDSANCGACGSVCPAGTACTDKVCGPPGAIAPFVVSVSPDSAEVGTLDPVLLHLKGQRFAAGATVRLSTDAGSTTLPTTYNESTHELTASLDASEATVGERQLRVVNPDRVISNASRFDLVPASPKIAAAAPQTQDGKVHAGAAADLLVTGSGFIVTSQCVVTDPMTLLEQPLTTTVTTSNSLSCRLDATYLAPASTYALKVVNPPGIGSNAWTFAIESQRPVATTVSPSSGGSSEKVQLLVTGTGFDASSVILFDGNLTGQPTQVVPPDQVYVDDLVLPPCLTGTSCSHTVTVRNGTVTSNALFFTVGSPPPAVTQLSPGSAYEGTAVKITFTGSGFSLTSKPWIELLPPGATTWTKANIPAADTDGTSVWGTATFGDRTEGFWSARVNFGTESWSSPFSFRVISSQIVLQSASPRGAAAGLATAPITLTATNLLPYATTADGNAKGIRAYFNGTPIVPSSVNVTSGSGTVAITLDTSRLATGTTYTLQLANPNNGVPGGIGSKSNALSFNITPGLPRLDSVCLLDPATDACGAATVKQQDAPVFFKLTGGNFAKPDASGAGGSSVHVSAASIDLADYAIPAALPGACDPVGSAQPVGTVCVLDAQTLRVKFDTRTAIAGTSYSVAVWNPGPQKSGTLPNAITVQ